MLFPKYIYEIISNDTYLVSRLLEDSDTLFLDNRTDP